STARPTSLPEPRPRRSSSPVYCQTGRGLRSCRPDDGRVRMAKFVEVETVRNWLADGGEIAFIDVREEGQHGAGHPLLAVNIPYTRLEAEIVRLVPRRSCRIVVLDDADGVAAKATRRLAPLGYADRAGSDRLPGCGAGSSLWRPRALSGNSRRRVLRRAHQ